MKERHLKIEIQGDAQTTFDKFIYDFGKWWPSEYTWSQDKLDRILMNAVQGGLCTEYGPHGFRCDWGRVTQVEDGKHIQFKWQISPGREPIPDPDKASEVVIIFSEKNETTEVSLQHIQFENHGDGHEEYRDIMFSEYGWPYIMQQFKIFCEK